MNAKLAILAILIPSAVAFAQDDSSSRSFSREYPRVVERERERDYDEGAGPFTREEARQLRSVWSTIREAANFYDINWRSVGLYRAPGNREARRFMAEDWGSLRRAEQFDDINWRAEYHRR